ncbi:MAG: hypothetical protein LIP01_09000 [Tannerellaceae bacterium]|nr:hypothetical protein [Tannerellaceae bacterium]
MRAVQTLWTCNKDLLNDGFGWLMPEHHLMAWTLSCLCLRENYDEVVLYTDSIGYAVLIEQLQLPYTNVVLAYDNFSCQEPLWGLAKLKTYFA